ncbi:hypothetical protein [Ottowia sp.]|uniref:hypothetical protein n=1 Tax=Ottowia sp. TaxID=1898956 RepID=UPI0039590116|nr:hypothetical protein [Pseudomonadota bacterium]
MASRHTNASARSRDAEVTLSQTTTDAPLLPVEQISRIKELAPERVDWIFNQTALESDARRAENRRVNTLIFVERLAGLVFALLVAIGGLGVAAYLAMHGHDLVASIIGGATLVGLVTAFVARNRAPPK